MGLVVNGGGLSFVATPLVSRGGTLVLFGCSFDEYHGFMGVNSGYVSTAETE